MSITIAGIVRKTLVYYRKSLLYQIFIITLLAAVITGSLLTGWSVRTSLKKSSAERLGNTGIILSSGIRYFDSDLGQRMFENEGIKSVGILEMKGYCQDLNSQKGAFNANIYATDSSFFQFNGCEPVSLKQGEVAINRRLADYLDVKTGDELIIRFRKISDIPADAPFAPEQDEKTSVVMKIGSVLDTSHGGNFSLAISQIVPMNIFMNLSDINPGHQNMPGINRLLIDKTANISISQFKSLVKKNLKLSDIGLKLREVSKTGSIELISDRVFIDKYLIEEAGNTDLHSAPLITYLGNRFISESGSTPYSFISAIPESIYPEIAGGDTIIINRWMSEDIKAGNGDSILVYWYSPDSLNKLKENKHRFIIGKVVVIKGIWSDSLLMPEFPGISGSESCSSWDAGIPIKTNEIRDKDEDYWNRYKGTPKAFISYKTGSELWGNNFGPATSIRFPENITREEIVSKLSGRLDPELSGFTVTDIASDSVTAAQESVDFGTLFISLGFFLIVAAIVLLSFAMSSYFDSKRGQIFTWFALGFNNRLIKKLLLFESALTGAAGCLAGAFAGIFVNMAITGALNSVWSGAVQTNTLRAFSDIRPIITGFAITFVITLIFIIIKIRSHLKKLNNQNKEDFAFPSPKLNLIVTSSLILLTAATLAAAFIFKEYDLALYFVAGTLLLASLIMGWRQYLIKPVTGISAKNLTHLYYSLNPSVAVSPVLFIAAGIFAVFIVGANRTNVDIKISERSSGTGGYTIWCENTIPVMEDLNSPTGRASFGLEDDSLTDLRFVMMKRSEGNDASCLNLNHITSPPLIGVDPSEFINNNSFSFAKQLEMSDSESPWSFLTKDAGVSSVYGIADQTVLEWGLKLSIGDTIILRSESGKPLNIIIAAGLKSSIFQGYILIGSEYFSKYFPSVSGSSLMLAGSDQGKSEQYKTLLDERLSNYGVHLEDTNSRLNSFNEVTNTYLSVFGIFGAFGMVTGIAGLGFVLLRTYNQRKKEFALMLATGFSFQQIKKIILKEQVLILLAGVSTGIVSAVIATLPSLLNNQNMEWQILLIMVAAILLVGFTVLILSVRSISGESLVVALKKE